MIQPHARYGRSFRPTAAKAWDAFFKHATPDCRIAHWWIMAYSSDVQVTGFNIDVHACEDDAVVTPYLAMGVDGFFDLIAPDDVVPSEEQVREYEKWVVQGIEDAFVLKRIQDKYQRSGLADWEFAVTWSPHQEELDCDPNLRVIWSNKKRLTAGAIRKRQAKANKQ
jgi:hypothetical protein